MLFFLPEHHQCLEFQLLHVDQLNLELRLAPYLLENHVPRVGLPAPLGLVARVAHFAHLCLGCLDFREFQEGPVEIVN